MKLCCCQFAIAWEDKPANFSRVRELLAAQPPEPGALVLLPEMFATGFSMNVDAIAEDPGKGATPEFLAATARQRGIYLAGGFVTRGTDGRGRNELAVYAPDGSRAARYAKIHPFSFGQESRHYTGGSEVCAFPWGEATAAPFICYDLRFPEIFRHAALAGAQLLVVIANWPASRAGHWRALAVARAIENQAYVACVNRVGRDPHHDYAGGSLIVGPRGEVLAEADAREEMLSAEIDLPSLQAYRREFPALADIHRRFLGGA